MKQLNAGDKIVRQMTRDGAVELNKATGGATNISMRDSPGVGGVAGDGGGVRSIKTNSAAKNAQNSGNRGNSLYTIGGVVDRVQMERKAAKRRTHKKANAEIYKRSQPKPEISRLKFTASELADPSMSKAIRKSDKATSNYNTAVKRISEPNGKSEMRLLFREGEKPVNGKLKHALDRPKQEAGAYLHKEVSKHEGDNTGVQAAHSTEKAAEFGAKKLGAGYRYLKQSPYRSALRHERKAVKANVNALYQRSLRSRPEIKNAGAIRKALHKRHIKKQYVKAFVGKGAAAGAKGVTVGAKGAAFAVKKLTLVKVAIAKAILLVKLAALKLAKLVAAAKVLIPIALIITLLLFILFGISSCVAMLGGFGQVIATSYTAEDEDILGAHNDYTALENQLANRITNIPNEFPGYDEYRFYLDPIEHAPHELISFLTALYLAFTQEEIQATLQNLFNQQYVLTLTSIVEVRTREETRTGTGTGIDPWGNPYTYTYTYTVTVVYNWYVLVTTLVNRTIREVAADMLTPEQYEMFLTLLATQGNRPDLFGGNGLSVELLENAFNEQLGIMFAGLLNTGQRQGTNGTAQAPTQETSGTTTNQTTQGRTPQTTGGNHTNHAANIPPAYLADSRFAAMITEAEQFLGFPYVWGGSNPATSFDCSGFVSWVVNQSGAGSVGRMTANGLYNHTVTIPYYEARPGDLVFFQGTWNTRGASHVGIYTGGGMMIHTGGNPAGVSFASIQTAYWQRHFKAFGRLP